MSTEESARILLTLGALFVAGVATDLVGRRTRLPRVTLLIVLGVVAGPGVLDLLPRGSAAWFELVSDAMLTMIGFLLGGTLTTTTLRSHGRAVVALSLAVVVGSAGATFLGLLALGFAPLLALLLAGLATATDPVATRDVIRETRRRDDFAQLLLGIVAVDDAWGLVAFSVLLSVALALGGDTAGDALLHGLRDLGGALVLGATLGVPMALLTGRIAPGEPTQAEAVGLVLLCGGLSLELGVSHLLAAMVMGLVVAGRARHHRRPFHAIEGIEWPFRTLFFVLAGATLEPASLLGIGGLGAAFVVLRTMGRIAGAWVAGRALDAPATLRRWTGVALLPQAGVAIGMGLVAVNAFPEARDRILPVIVGTTVLFELLGPLTTRLALRRVPEGTSVPA